MQSIALLGEMSGERRSNTELPLKFPDRLSYSMTVGLYLQRRHMIRTDSVRHEDA